MTHRFRKLSHSIYECKYHIVFCPKYRYRVLRDEIAAYVEREIHTLCSHKDAVEVIEANVQADHIHLVLGIPPKYAVSVVVEHGGGGSSAAAPIARDVMLQALYEGLPPLDAYPSGERARAREMQDRLELRDIRGPRIADRA